MNRPKGFTLIEVLVGMALVAVLLVGTAELLLRAQQISRQTDSGIRSTDLLTATLESVKSGPFDGPDLAAGDILVRIEVPNRKPVILERHVENLLPDIKRVGVEVYETDQKEHAIRASLLISRRLGF